MERERSLICVWIVLLSAVAEVSAQLYEEHPAPRLVCKASREREKQDPSQGLSSDLSIEAHNGFAQVRRFLCLSVSGLSGLSSLSSLPEQSPAPQPGWDLPDYSSS
jgi:hypothetical protein